jgi:hypothetical protein
MKKLLCCLCLCSLFVVYAQADIVTPTPSLGWWNEGDAGTTHQYWDFTPINVHFNPGDGYTSSPESVISPDPLSVLATISPRGAYDNQGAFVGPYIFVNLEIPNYPVLNKYKEIWVDLGNAMVVPDSIAVSAAGNGLKTTDYRCEILPGNDVSEFGVRIWPNPGVEKIQFMILGTTAPAVLDYIHVDTICIPEPATVGILSLGALSLIRRKKLV